MIRRSILFVTVLSLAAATAEACRFNVRDVGFVDLGSSAYKFYCFVSRETSPTTVTSIKQIATAAFLDVNVEPEVVELGDGLDPAIASYYKDAGEPETPAGVLVSTDGESAISIPLVDRNESLDESLWSAMESTFESPVRDRVIEQAIENFGVILLVEGDDNAENVRAKGFANAVIQRVAGSMDKLEKEIKNPPVLVSLSRAEAVSDKVLLWSLGIDPESVGANVAILYGRGRTIGSVLTGDNISEQELFRIVATIGLDCECGLDRSWMQGKMIPLKWGSTVQTRVAGLLGFDAEDPRIKMEMSQILSKSSKGNGGGRQRAGDGQNLDTFLANYEETSVEVPQTVGVGETATDKVAAPPERSNLAIVVDAKKQRPARKFGLIALGATAALVLVTGLIIVLRGKLGGS